MHVRQFIVHSLQLGLLACLFLTSQAFASYSCSITSTSVWGDGYQLDVTVTNDGPGAISGWTVALNFDTPTNVVSSWNATESDGDSATPLFTNCCGWNGNLAEGQSTTFGLQGTYSGEFQAPTCSGDGTPASSSSSSSSLSASSSSSSSAPSEGANTIVVRALGTNGDESVSLQVGGSTVETWTMTTGMQNYTATTDRSGEVRVAFTNDATDRDVQVDYIQVNGQAREAENQNVNTGLWANDACGGGSNSEWMHCNGHISFGDVTGSSSSSSSSSSSGDTGCELPSTLSWTSSQPLITPKNGNASVKDPTIVPYEGRHHLFATVYNSGYKSIYMNFEDFNQAGSANQLSFAPGGSSTVAPQVFYFEPHDRWYIITQWGGRYATNPDINNPDGWSSLQPLLAGEPSGSLDFWVICDDTHCYLFFSRDDGDLYMSKTTIANFPNFSGYTTVMSGPRNVLFEAANVYKVQGTDQYLLLVEGWQSGPRFFRAWTSTSLDGPWTEYKTSESAPFAGLSNVSFPGGQWTNDISHGEMLRAGHDQRMEIDACNMQFLYQGRDPNANVDYDLLPYELGLISAD
ncbi:non-reducing end alpha-L-arabinofuranosidase family hydrolase [Marinimicrobium locisalis]|uniref:non-reducing end alpha-L-arabinofuranosidase family hydrolase n=1 Tax=Marinimicrobium locisalis TaxID=546022 RepID=UPI0032219C1D